MRIVLPVLRFVSTVHLMARLAFFLALWTVFGSTSTCVAEVRVAVASNFAATFQRLAARFEQQTGQGVRSSTGSTGLLYEQIRAGAPFDVLVAADAEHPARLIAEGLAVEGSRVSYAEGRLVLWGPAWAEQRPRLDDMLSDQVRHIAIAKPGLAPYGAAARQVLEQSGLWGRVQDKLVYGENVGQAFQFVASGNAELGLVAWAQVLAGPWETPPGYWLVPRGMHEPLIQDAVLLKTGETNAAARALLSFLAGEEAQEVIRASGYHAGP